MQVDDIISDAEVVAEEKVNFKNEMNFGIGRNHSVLLRSIRKGAPIADEIDAKTGTIIYEGHDQPAYRTGRRGPRSGEVAVDLSPMKGSL